MTKALKNQPLRVGIPYFNGRHPGVYLENKFGLPHGVDFWTGVPAFLGVANATMSSGRTPEPNAPVLLSLWSQFEDHLGKPQPDSYLAYAVRGFFENGGERCYVVPLQDNSYMSLYAGLQAIEVLDTVDLVCAPDLVRDAPGAFELQQMVVNHCEETANRFAILDSRFGDSCDEVALQWSEIDGKNGAIYYPWITVRGFDARLQTVPPCGHIAGVYARVDRTVGVHKAPANELLHGVIDVERHLTNAQQDKLNPKRINCLRTFAGRGIRVWGARTLSGQRAWTYVNVRRIFLTAVRWIEANMSDVVFEPNNASLWLRIQRELTTYFSEQFLRGALKGQTPKEAFYIKCDAETNTPEYQDSGHVVTEIGLAPTNPYEFVVIRLIHGEKGVTLDGPIHP